MYQDEQKDYGFEMPDIRYEYEDINENNIKIVINRQWYQCNEHGESDYYCYFRIEENNKTVMTLPKHVDESMVTSIALQIYPENDNQDRREYYDLIAWERKMLIQGREW
jgi:hypothetical protein